jgi:hypothetical protein
MKNETLEEWIRAENGDLPSVDDQVWLAQWAKRRELFVDHDEVLRTKQIKETAQESVDYNPETLLHNLEEIGVFEKVEPQGNRSFIRSERTGEAFFTPDDDEFPPLLAEEISKLLEDIQNEQVAVPITDGGTEEDPETLRSIAAEALEVKPEMVEEEITQYSDPVKRMDRYETVVEAIIESDEVQRSGNYDLIGWRNAANRWGLSKRAELIAKGGV